MGHDVVVEIGVGTVGIKGAGIWCPLGRKWKRAGLLI